MRTEKKKIIDNPWNNIGVIFVTVIVFTTITMSAPDLNQAELGGLANLFFPAVFGLITILIYLISRIFIRKWNWIITICGIIYIGYLSIMLFFDKL
ncbi:hypothetical protein C7S20_18610 [Christiangramia fulva]|uniref:Uncharacterized protein n=1 Tax=Christiangramia fulva TaxID=2126553 RepID=A0A2R3Z9Y2_9FLAO|nr:hypothetical protein [Christiangramia fulva]AVR47098.1 hypothetical protein C7S20_18610 [Christiangramia fulva]